MFNGDDIFIAFGMVIHFTAFMAFGAAGVADPCRRTNVGQMTGSLKEPIHCAVVYTVEESMYNNRMA